MLSGQGVEGRKVYRLLSFEGLLGVFIAGVAFAKAMDPPEAGACLCFSLEGGGGERREQSERGEWEGVGRGGTGKGGGWGICHLFCIKAGAQLGCKVTKKYLKMPQQHTIKPGKIL